MKHCLRQKCGAKFEPKKKKQVYCSTKCRTYDYRERLAAAKTELKEPLPKEYVRVNDEKTKGSKGIVELVKENIIEAHKGVTLKDIAPILGVKKKTYSELLEDAKNGVLNEAELKSAKLSPNQYELIKRKIKQQQ